MLMPVRPRSLSPTKDEPVRSVPMKLPAMRFPEEPPPSTATPVATFATTLPAPRDVPPTILPGASTRVTPVAARNPRGLVPLTSVPIKLPETTLPVAEAPAITMFAALKSAVRLLTPGPL